MSGPGSCAKACARASAVSVLRPAWPGYLADPAVIRLGDCYYAYGTDGPEGFALGQTGRIFPILRSRDLERWEFVGGALVPPPLDVPAFWAPEVAYKDDRCYMYYSCGGLAGEGHKLRLAVSDQPEGPFEDQGVEVVPDEPFSIDGHPFLDPRSGSWFLVFAKDFFDEAVGTGIAAAPLRSDMTRLEGPPVTILRARAEWQVFERDRLWYGKVWPKWHTVEGPYVVYREGRYWLFYSGGRWEAADYGIGCAVSENVLGPYHDAAVLEGPSVLRTGWHGLTGPGHNSIVSTETGDVMAFHAWDESLSTRRLHIARLMWTAAGPRVNPSR